MITARFAGEQGRLVFAVPGRIDQPSSAGCHQLIRDGAILLTSVEDLLQELNYLDGLRPQPIPEKPAFTAGENIGELTEEEHAVFSCFDGGEILSLDVLGQKTPLSPAQIASTLMMLELKCLVTKRSDGLFEARGR
jgi:DNA processing protein